MVIEDNVLGTVEVLNDRENVTTSEPVGTENSLMLNVSPEDRILQTKININKGIQPWKTYKDIQNSR